VRESAAPLYRGHTVDVLALVQRRRVYRHLDAALPESGDDNLRYPGERAAGRRLVPAVRGAAGQEDRDGQHAEERGDAVPKLPADAGLHPHQHGAAEQTADVDGEVEPVEEGALPPALLLVGLVELVRAEQRQHRLQRAAQRQQVQPRVEGRALQRHRRAHREHHVGLSTYVPETKQENGDEDGWVSLLCDSASDGGRRRTYVPRRR